MRNRSPKREQLLREVESVRQEYREWSMICQYPRCVQSHCDVHEIARGPARQEALGERCALLYLCREHHREMDNYLEWPIARQAALKLIVDPDHYDLEKLNTLRGRASDAISHDEVVIWLEYLGGMFCDD